MTRRRGDPGKTAIAARLRNETTLPIKWIAARVQIGTTKGAKAVLHHFICSSSRLSASCSKSKPRRPLPAADRLYFPIRCSSTIWSSAA
jgi:hypothetical protein